MLNLFKIKPNPGPNVTAESEQKKVFKKKCPHDFNSSLKKPVSFS
jgi:hypothetical protein